MRDRESGKSKGFAFLCYEDQRSTVLAVDNLNGITLADRVIRVDHISEYKIPKEIIEAGKLYTPSGADGKGYGEFRELNENDLNEVEKDEEEVREDKLKRMEARKIDEDERWEQELMRKAHGSKESKELRKLKKAYKKLKREKKKN